MSSSTFRELLARACGGRIPKPTLNESHALLHHIERWGGQGIDTDEPAEATNFSRSIVNRLGGDLATLERIGQIKGETRGHYHFKAKREESI